MTTDLGSQERLSLGPALLGLVVGVQTMFWLWGIWWPGSPDPATLDTLTDLGQGLYQSDRDGPFYLLGSLLCLSLMAFFASRWRSLMLAAHGRPESEIHWLNCLMAAHFPVAAGLALLRLLHMPARSLSLMAAALGLLFGAVALGLARKKHASAWLLWRPGNALQAAAVALLVVLLVYVPFPSQLVGQAYQADRLHHLDFYAMSPALAFHRGGALGTDYYTQYGVGWPMLASAFAHMFGSLSYKLLLSLGIAWACIYFLALYGFLRLLVRHSAWAVAGLLLALMLQLFGGTDGRPKWLWPSSTVMRYSMDVFVFACFLLHARKRLPWLGLPTGFFVGLALLFGTDTGIYLLVCLCCYLLSYSRLRPDGARPPQLAKFAFLTLGSFVTVFVIGLALASRGTFVKAEFWLGWTESLRMHSDGFGHLPIASAVNNSWTAYLLLLMMLLCYLFALARLVEGLSQRSLSPKNLLRGLVALYGMATLLLFIGRSHPFNLHHPSIPFCILLTSYLAQAWNGIKQGINSAHPTGGSFGLPLVAAVPYACAYLLLLAICVNVRFENYPNVYFSLLQEPRRQAAQQANSNFLFASRQDGPLSNNRLEEIARFRAISETMRSLSDSGRSSVAIISSDETAYMLEADQAPIFRYSPILASMALKSQLVGFLKALESRPPDFVILPLEVPRVIQNVPVTETFNEVMQTIRRNFKPDGQVADMMIYRRLTERTQQP